MALKRDMSTCPHCGEQAITYAGLEVDEDSLGHEYLIEQYKCDACGSYMERVDFDWYEDWSEYLLPGEKVQTSSQNRNKK